MAGHWLQLVLTVLNLAAPLGHVIVGWRAGCERRGLDGPTLRTRFGFSKPLLAALNAGRPVSMGTVRRVDALFRSVPPLASADELFGPVNGAALGASTPPRAAGETAIPEETRAAIGGVRRARARQHSA